MIFSNIEPTNRCKKIIKEFYISRCYGVTIFEMCHTTVVVILLLLIAVAPRCELSSSSSSSSPTWHYHDGSCYRFSTDDYQRFVDKSAECQTYGGAYVAEIETAQEMDFVLDLISADSHQFGEQFWLGLERLDGSTDCEFVWISSLQTVQFSIGCSSTTEQCARLKFTSGSTYQIQDASCRKSGHVFRAICEKPVVVAAAAEVNNVINAVNNFRLVTSVVVWTTVGVPMSEGLEVTTRNKVQCAVLCSQTGRCVGFEYYDGDGVNMMTCRMLMFDTINGEYVPSGEFYGIDVCD